MPYAIRRRFTEGQRAVLTVIANEVRAKGACTLSMVQIARTAGVCDSWARETIRLARLELLEVTARPQKGRPNLTNIIRIISRDWLAWIKTGGRVQKNPAPIGKTAEKRETPRNSGVSAEKRLAEKRRDGEGEARSQGRSVLSGRDAALAKAMTKTASGSG
jgi:hypothetical protein